MGRTPWWFAIVWDTRASATGFSSRTAPKSRTSWIATWRFRPPWASRCRGRCFRWIGTTGPGSGGPTATTPSLATWRSSAIEYGFRFDAPEAPGFDLVMAVRMPDGRRRKVDIRTLPFLRFDGNEAHDQRRYGLDLGGGLEGQEEKGVGGIGPDPRHPFVIRNLLVWYSHWGVSPAAPSVLIDGLDLTECDYGFWHPRYEGQAYRGVVTYRTRWPEAFTSGQRPEEKRYPAPLDPVDDRPPVTVITRISPLRGRKDHCPRGHG